MLPFLGISKKRKLTYQFHNQSDEKGFEDLNAESPTKECPKKKQRLTRSLASRENDWQRRMDGFDDVHVSSEECLANKRTKKSTTKYVLEKFSHGEESTESQLNIDWGSDTEEGTAEIKEKEVFKNIKNVKRSLSKRDNKSRALPKPQFYNYAENSSKSCEEGDIFQAESPGPELKKGSLSSQTNHKTATSTGAVRDVIEIQESEGFSESQIGSKNQINSPSDSPSISSPSSTNTGESPNTSRPKASDWARSVQAQLISPEKDRTMPEYQLEDSAKKAKPKYLRDGMAERLQKLVAREKSDLSFWYHKMKTAEKKPESTRRISVQICESENGPSRCLAKCSVLNQMMDGHNFRPTDTVFALFNNFLGKKPCAMGPGTVVNIFPPWQILSCAIGKVLLCTNHCEIIVPGSQQPDDTLLIATNKSLSLAMEWRCPCSQEMKAKTDIQDVPNYISDITILPSHCQAHQFPCQQYKVDVARTNCHSPDVTQQSGLQVYTSPPTSPLNRHTSILSSIGCRGGSAATGVNFSATIQRVYQKTLQKSDKRLRDTRTSTDPTKPPEGIPVWSVLVQDAYGFICEVNLPTHACDKPEWKELISSGEGKQFAFNGLKVAQRLKKDRCHKFFSLINSVWREDNILSKDTSQDSSENSQPVMIVAQPPSFSYTLQAVLGESGCKKTGDDSSMFILRETMSIPQIMKKMECRIPWRVNFEGILIYATTYGLGEACIHRLYLVDLVESPQEKQIPIVIEIDSTFQASMVLNWANNLRRKMSFKDVLCFTGKLVLDDYSSIKVLSTESCPVAQIVLSPMTELSTTGQLVSVKGEIINVDIENAYSYTVCNMCGNESLSGGTVKNPFVVCTICKRACDKPVVKLRMDVFISCDNFTERSAVKVQLEQSTIDNLLPTTDHEEEGLDMECLLHKPIGPLSCVVTSMCHGDKRTKQWIVAEIIL